MTLLDLRFGVGFGGVACNSAEPLNTNFAESTSVLKKSALG